MNETEAYYESSRCLFCHDAPCINACPTKIDIPLFIRQISTGNINGSAKTIYQSNYFGRVCGYVCPTDVLCEGACVYTNQKMRPVEIGRLQVFATNNLIKQDNKFIMPAKNNGKKVAIIGAGPSGISCACELQTLGFIVDVFEAKSHPSGLIIYGVAPYKITNNDVLEEMDYLENQFGYNAIYNTPIIEKKDLIRIDSEYDAVFLGIGLGDTTEIGIPGEDLENCVGAVEFIEKLKMNQHQTKIGKKVIVLGGGNTAMDAASECSRLGAERVILCYRRSVNEMRAYWFEYDLAKSVGSSGVFQVVPLEIVGKNKVEGIKFAKSETMSGIVKVIADSEFIEPCDMVIKATGQAKFKNFLSKIDNLNLDEKGRIIINTDNGQTTNPKYFAGGDAVNGGKEVVNAAAEGKIAAKGIHEFVFGKNL
jgi:glutamate synthase (NADPH/NADH) small chain